MYVHDVYARVITEEFQARNTTRDQYTMQNHVIHYGLSYKSNDSTDSSFPTGRPEGVVRLCELLRECTHIKVVSVYFLQQDYVLSPNVFTNYRNFGLTINVAQSECSIYLCTGRRFNPVSLADTGDVSGLKCVACYLLKQCVNAIYVSHFISLIL